MHNIVHETGSLKRRAHTEGVLIIFVLNTMDCSITNNWLTTTNNWLTTRLFFSLDLSLVRHLGCLSTHVQKLQ